MVEGYLLDTNVASWLVDSRHTEYHRARAKFVNVTDDLLFIGIPTIAEIEFGFALPPNPDHVRQSQMRSVLRGYKHLIIDRHTAQYYANIRAILYDRYMEKNYRGLPRNTTWIQDLRDLPTMKELHIQEPDLWLVSIAVQYNLMFVTLDRLPNMRAIVAAAGHDDRTYFWDRSDLTPL